MTGPTINEQVIPVRNQVVALQYQMPVDTSITNQSSTLSVWISNNSGMFSGQGQRIGPLGSLKWTTPATPVFAILDAASPAGSVAMLTVSSNVDQLNNPVDVGIAVAVELAATGIPNVLVTDDLGVFALPLAGQAVIDVSRYATVHVLDAGNNGPIFYGFSDVDNAGLLVGGPNRKFVYKDWFGTTSLANDPVEFSSPVRARYLYLEQINGAGQTARVYGSNRSSTRQVRNAGNFNPLGLFGGYEPVANRGIYAETASLVGFSVPMVPMGLSRYPAGEMYCIFNIGGAVAKGEFRVLVDDAAGGVRVVPIADTSEAGWHAPASGTVEQRLYKYVSFPNDAYALQFRITTADAGMIASLRGFASGNGGG